MPIHALFADSILSHGQVFHAHALLVENGHIRALVPQNEVPADVTRLKYEGLTLAAGLVDAQVNGGGGILFNTQPEKLGELCAAHLAMGTTALLPTHITDDIKKIPQALEAVKNYRAAHPYGSVAGLHLEGPFLNSDKKGIHPAPFIAEAEDNFLQSLSPEGVGALLLTLAPEKVNVESLQALTARGVIVSAGHSMATAAQLKATCAAGLRGVTHLYNAMSGPSARDLNDDTADGLSTAALEDKELFCSIICDNAHVHPARIRAALVKKPAGKLFLVSDAMPPAGQHPPHDFDLLGQKIFARNGRCEDADGRLAGAALTLFECLRIAVKEIGIPLPLAHAMASYYPATFLKLDKILGSFQPHTRADIIGFDKTLKLEKVWLAGEEVRVMPA